MDNALSGLTTGICAWILTLLIYACTILLAVRAHWTLRPTVRWYSKVSRYARARSLVGKFSANTVRSAWRWVARVYPVFFCVKYNGNLCYDISYTRFLNNGKRGTNGFAYFRQLDRTWRGLLHSSENSCTLVRGLLVYIVHFVRRHRGKDRRIYCEYTLCWLGNRYSGRILAGICSMGHRDIQANKCIAHYHI